MTAPPTVVIARLGRDLDDRGNGPACVRFDGRPDVIHCRALADSGEIEATLASAPTPLSDALTEIAIETFAICAHGQALEWRVEGDGSDYAIEMVGRADRMERAA